MLVGENSEIECSKPLYDPLPSHRASAGPSHGDLLYIAMLFYCVPEPYVNFGDLSKMMITILPEPVALVGWSPNSQDLFYS